MTKIAVRNSETGEYLDLSHQDMLSSSSEEQIIELAARISGNLKSAQCWYLCPRSEFNDLSPQQMVRQGKSDLVAGVFLNIAGQ